MSCWPSILWEKYLRVLHKVLLEERVHLRIHRRPVALRSLRLGPQPETFSTATRARTASLTVPLQVAKSNSSSSEASGDVVRTRR